MWLSFEGGAAKSNKSLDGKRQQMNFHRGRITFQPPTASASGEGSVARYHFQRSKIPSRNVLGKARKRSRTGTRSERWAGTRHKNKSEYSGFSVVRGCKTPKAHYFKANFFGLWILEKWQRNNKGSSKKGAAGAGTDKNKKRKVTWNWGEINSNFRF